MIAVGPYLLKLCGYLIKFIFRLYQHNLTFFVTFTDINSKKL